MKYGKSRDHNEADIVSALRGAGAIVWPLESNITAGIPDLLVGVNGFWVACEVKTPRGRLSIAQRKKQNTCANVGLPYRVLVTVEDAADLMQEWEAK